MLEWTGENGVRDGMAVMGYYKSMFAFIAETHLQFERCAIIKRSDDRRDILRLFV